MKKRIYSLLPISDSKLFCEQEKKDGGTEEGSWVRTFVNGS